MEINPYFFKYFCKKLELSILEVDNSNLTEIESDPDYINELHNQVKKDIGFCVSNNIDIQTVLENYNLNEIDEHYIIENFFYELFIQPIETFYQYNNMCIYNENGLHYDIKYFIDNKINASNISQNNKDYFLMVLYTIF
jgi:hypothetical protein